MKLEFKHLASYLPFKLKYKFASDNVYYDLIGLDFDYLGLTHLRNGEKGYSSIELSKPILFPLSSLTKEITIDGEKFIPIEVIMKSIGINGEITIDDEPCFGWDESYGDDAQGYAVCFNTEKLFFGVCYWEDIYEGIFTDKMLYELPFEYKQFQKLLEWKFDVFGLIEAGLAEPVTEEFNPYK